MHERRNYLIAIVFSGCLLAAIQAAVSNGADEVLMTSAKSVLGSLPAAIVSDQNPLTPEKTRLGKLLFYETRISIDGTVSCARCHPISLYGADGLRKAIGNNCRTSPRNVPTVLNAAGQISEHWIGNRESVEDQARQSITGPASFGMPSSDSLEAKLRVFQDYEGLFKSAFPNEREPVSAVNFGLAVGAFERTLVTPSPFDSFLKGEENALTEKQKAGLDAFLEIGCVNCHSGPYVGGQMYQKFGTFEPYWQYTKSEQVDEGRFAATKKESDRYVFKVPVLRNVEKTSPYFHDGSVDKLEDAVSMMGKIQLGKELPELQVAEITSFLESLTGEIPADALKVPLLPSKKSEQ